MNNILPKSGAEKDALKHEIKALYGVRPSLPIYEHVLDEYRALFIADNYGCSDAPPLYHPYFDVTALTAARRLRLLSVLPYIERCDVTDFLKAQGESDPGRRAVFEAGKKELLRRCITSGHRSGSPERLCEVLRHIEGKLINDLVANDAVNAYSARLADNAEYIRQALGREPQELECLTYTAEIEQIRHHVINEGLARLNSGTPAADVADYLRSGLVLCPGAGGIKCNCGGKLESCTSRCARADMRLSYVTCLFCGYSGEEKLYSLKSGELLEEGEKATEWFYEAAEKSDILRRGGE